MKTRNWRLVVCGVTHKTSSLRQREPLQISTDELPRANALLAGLPEVMESAIVSTCNRGEFYFVTGRETDPLNVVARFYQSLRGIDISPYRELFQIKKGRHAADHLFRVAAGIDSMILGENQILGQVKDAYSSACAVKSAGKVVHRLFHQAFRVGKQVRTDTDIGKGACSVSTAAVEMLEDTMRGLENPVVLIIGVNQILGLAAKRLGQIEGCRLLFANRTPEKAVSFAAGFEAEAYGLDKLPALLTRADIVISGTASREPIVTRQTIEQVAARRPARRLVIVDLAVPRDFDVTEGLAPSIESKNMDDIDNFVKNHQQQRELAIPQAEEIIDRRTDEFSYWYGHVQHEPIYNGRKNTYDSIREEELGPVLKKLTPELQSQLDEAARRLVDRVIRAAAAKNSE